jgi:hypothetical protein
VFLFQQVFQFYPVSQILLISLILAQHLIFIFLYFLHYSLHFSPLFSYSLYPLLSYSLFPAFYFFLFIPLSNSYTSLSSHHLNLINYHHFDPIHKLFLHCLKPKNGVLLRKIKSNLYFEIPLFLEEHIHFLLNLSPTNHNYSAPTHNKNSLFYLILLIFYSLS